METTVDVYAPLRVMQTATMISSGSGSLELVDFLL